MDAASEPTPPQTTEIQVESAENVATYETVQGAESAQVSSDNSKGTVESGTAGNQSSENGTIGKLASGLFAEEERLWGIVKANSLDFDAWTALIEETEKLAGDRVWKIRKVYDEFLAEFPLCYGYWKKYADHEARIGSMNKVLEVYERAVVGVTYSVDIWLHYCTFYTTIYRDPETIRRHFERALAYVGADYLSYPLWDKYIEYEEIQGDWRHVAMLYTRILEIPNRRLDDYLLRFKTLAASRPLSDLKTPEETIPPQNESVEPNAVPSETEQFEQYVSIREEIYKKTKEFDSSICDFENSIRRPYFHVRPLNISELENWHSYLNFIEQTGDLNKAVRLYERCLIACANYNDYWIRYVLFMEASGSPDIANNALARAANLFVKRQPEIHLFAARFREKNGDVPGARAAYQLVHTQLVPGFLDAIIKHANMEHRVGNSVEALSLYEQAIANEKAKENSPILPLLYSQYARFLLLVCKNTEKAMTLFSEAIERFHVSKPILQTLMHFESIQPLHKRTEYVDSLVEKFISPSTENAHVPVPEREEISYVFMEFLDMFGNSQSIAKAEDRHNRFFLPHKTVTAVRKRQHDDGLAYMGAYPNAQQWPTGYAQQGAYGGYAAQGTVEPVSGYGQPLSGQPPAAVQPPYYGGYY